MVVKPAGGRVFSGQNVIVYPTSVPGHENSGGAGAVDPEGEGKLVGASV